MKRIMAVVPLLAWIGCVPPNPYPAGSMLAGKLISLSEGTLLPVGIELVTADRGGGKITANDPVSGETFTGTYTFIAETKVRQDSRPGFLGYQETNTSVHVSDVVPGMATLVGDKGTVISLKMTIKAGHPPVGMGEGVDNKNRKYSFQF